MRRDEPLDIVERGKGQPRLRSVHDVHDGAPPVRRRTLDMERQFGGHGRRRSRVARGVAHRDVDQFGSGECRVDRRLRGDARAGCGFACEEAAGGRVSRRTRPPAGFGSRLT